MALHIELESDHGIPYSKECVASDYGETHFVQTDTTPYEVYLQMSQQVNSPIEVKVRGAALGHQNEDVVTDALSPMMPSSQLIKVERTRVFAKTSKKKKQKKMLLNWNEKDSGYGGSDTDGSTKAALEVYVKGTEAVHMCKIDRTIPFSDIWLELKEKVGRLAQGHECQLVEEFKDGSRVKIVRPSEYCATTVECNRTFSVIILNSDKSRLTGKMPT